MPAATTLLQAMEIFGKGVHRICVLDSQKTDKTSLLGVLTQSNVANYLYSKLQQIPNALKPLKELQIVTKTVKAINAEAQVFQALALMNEHGLSSLPMVDHSGRLCGSISMSDVS